MQFHPTALAGSSLLLSEALRGDGALLLDDNGDRFVEELAPRDVVARAIKARGSVRLDLRHMDRTRFPALMQRLVDAGFHPESEPVPVAPAAHYTMGGVVTDLEGATDVPGLYVAGESACTGVHGANRLASNSMLECLVFGRRAALAALAEPPFRTSPRAWPSDMSGMDEVPVTPELREDLWEKAGLIRDADGLARADVVAAPAHVARRALRARAGGEPRRPFPRRLPRRGRGARRAAHRPAAGARAGAGVMELTGFDVRAFLAEDVGDGDLTSESVVPADAQLEAFLLLKEEGVVCGLDVAEAVFRELDPGVEFERRASDGDVTRGEVARVAGNARALLTGERTALNLLGRLSGVATLTRRYVDAVAGTGATILDTRKTTPGLRALEKLAVRCGGGTNHRFGLYDGVLIKDNHLRLGGGIAGPFAARRGPAYRSRSSARRSTTFAPRSTPAPTSCCSTT